MTEVGAILIVVGAMFAAAAGLGLLRLPDVFTRLHAASKAGPLGCGLILLGLAVASADLSIALRCVLGFTFLIVTSPVSAHLLSKAALKSGTPPISGTSIDVNQLDH